MDQIYNRLPGLEHAYNSRRCKKACYRLVSDVDKGTHMVAARTIKAGEVILVEEPLGRQSMRPSMALLTSPEARPYLDKLNCFARDHGYFPYRGKRYSLDIEEALNKMAELDASDFAKTLPEANLREIWKLADCRRVAMVGDTVQIEGLQSEQGRAINGKSGRVVAQRGSGRMAVEVFVNGSSTETLERSIKQANLKTLGSIMNTNAFGDNAGEYRLVFKDLSRANHACGRFRNAIRWFGKDGKGFLVAEANISSGENILIDYITDETNPLLRHEQLRVLYNFSCQCPLH